MSAGICASQQAKAPGKAQSLQSCPRVDFGSPASRSRLNRSAPVCGRSRRSRRIAALPAEQTFGLFDFGPSCYPRHLSNSRFVAVEVSSMKSIPRGIPTKHPKSTGPESIGPERTDFGIVPRRAVGSPAATTLETNEKFRASNPTENELRREVGGGTRIRTGGQQVAKRAKALLGRLNRPTPVPLA